ncbi:ABC transporter permease [Priestia endophytica]|uniref:ABC transporter permease n=1 Tax=Priestia endophytica TaxID=135735 RepID=UPI00227E2658|nr:ABC transporter permease [Priestia endophytica]MCY8233974.1 ABC transporter permease [Priestia endophytica]
MGNFGKVLGFHLKEQFGKKGFWIGIIIPVIAIIGFFGFTHFKSDGEKDTIAIVNKGTTYQVSDNAMLGNLKEDYKFKFLEGNQVSKAQQGVKDGDYEALYIIEEQSGKPVLEQRYEFTPPASVTTVLQGTLQQQYSAKVSTEQGISGDVLKELQTPITIKDTVLDSDTDDKPTGVVWVFVFTMYMFILVYGIGIANGIVGEKSSRVMEIMITKVKPITMMYGKIISNMLVGLANILVILGSFLVAKSLGWADSLALGFIDVSGFTVSVTLLFILFFLLGFMLNGMIYAALGSLVSRTEDINNSTFPLTLVSFANFFLGFMTMGDPTASYITICSYIPVLTPTLMFSRYLMGSAAGWELALGAVIIIVTTLLISIIANRLYKRGVMKYSEKMSWKQVFGMMKKESVKG